MILVDTQSVFFKIRAMKMSLIKTKATLTQTKSSPISNLFSRFSLDEIGREFEKRGMR